MLEKKSTDVEKEKINPKKIDLDPVKKKTEIKGI